MNAVPTPSTGPGPDPITGSFFAVPSPSPLTGFFAALAAVGLYMFYRSLLPQPIPGIPYNKEAARSILGDLPALIRASKEDSATGWFIEQSRRHNSPVSQTLEPFGRKPLVLLSDFREAQDIFLRRKEWDRSDWSIELMSGVVPYHQINMKTGAAWKSHRRLLQDLMTPWFLHDVAASNIYGSVETLLHLWKERIEVGGARPFEAVNDIYLTAFDAVLDFGFGSNFPHRGLPPQLARIRGLSDTEREAMRNEADKKGTMDFGTAPLHEVITATLRASETMGEVLAAPSAKWAWRLLGLKPSERRAKHARNVFLEDQCMKAAERLKNQGGLSQAKGKDGGDAWVKCAVDLMMDRETKFAEKEGREPVYWSPVMRDEVLGFVIAGHDTSSTTLLWGLKFLTDNPTAQTTLRTALRAFHFEAQDAHRLPSAGEIARSNIPYLDAVIEEILRCACTAPVLERQCTQDTTVLGHFLPKGTTVLMFGWGPTISEPGVAVDESLRSPTSRAAAKERGVRAWDNKEGKEDKQAMAMDKFLPERWLTTDEKGEEVYDAAAGPALPFGLGLRGCFGRRLAYLELRIVITLLIWSFELLPTPEEISGHKSVDAVTRKPRQCFVSLREVDA